MFFFSNRDARYHEPLQCLASVIGFGGMALNFEDAHGLKWECTFVKWHFLVGSIVWWKKFDAIEAAVTTFTGADDDVDYDLDSDRTCALTATNHTNISTRWTMELNANTGNRKKWMRVYTWHSSNSVYLYFFSDRETDISHGYYFFFSLSPMRYLF